jgi:hypothetical protein
MPTFAGGRPWIKWAVIAVLLIAVGAGMLLARKMGSFSHPANMANPPASGPAGAAVAGKDGISQEDKARADALVGPLNRDAPAAPAVEEAPAPAPQSPPPPSEPLSKPAAATAAGSAEPSQPAAAASARPAAQPRPNPPPPTRTQPTLDDLLD